MNSGLVDLTKKRTILYLFIVIVIINGCEKSSPTAPLPIPNPPSFSGNWTAVSSDLTFSVIEKDNKLYGTCVYLNLVFVANGDENYPNVSLKLERAGFYPATYTGIFIHPDTINGNLNGSGFVNANMVIARH